VIRNGGSGPLIVVAAALADRAGRVLLQRRAPGRAMAGLWEFPGGKVEPGETPEAALARELEEELGLSVAPAALVPVTFASAPLGDRQMLLLLYLCRRWSGTPRARAADADALAWLKPEDMDAAAMPPADAPFIPALAALLPALAALLG